MSSRKCMRPLLFSLILFALFALAFSLDPHLHFHGRRTLKSPQQRYLDERQQYSSQFRKFKSTLARLHPPPDFDNPHILLDPRFKGKEGTDTPRIYYPYPDYESDEWKNSHRGSFVACVGPRGKLLNESLDDQVGVYIGIPEGFPEPMFGSHKAVGLDGRISFDRYTRYGAYGFGESESSVDNWMKPEKVEWDQVDWGTLQEECLERNADRFPDPYKNADQSYPSGTSNLHIPPQSRTAVLIRSYTGKVYSENDKQVIRSMITELALQSGGEYEVVLLVHVRDDNIPIDDPEVCQQVLRENVPQEFWGITTLWNMPTAAARYPLVDPALVDVHHSQWFSVQHFMLENPQFEYFWNWEIDARFTGHLYELLEKIAEFGRNQPRRGIWERSERFYIPQIHGDYNTSFRKFAEEQAGQLVWGPLAIDYVRPMPLVPKGPTPPVKKARQDDYQWGVGEEADYIGFLPIFNPINTDWVIRNEVSGYFGPDTPRRATLITHSRVSRRLLLTMDDENLLGRHMGSELFAQSVAILHGFKGVTIPHPIYSERSLPPHRVDRWFNSGINGRSGSTKDSPFSWGREARFQDLSWYYRSNLPGRLYWNFLGWEKEGTGGKSYERWFGRVCLPSIMFHPVKDVEPLADSTHYELPV
ncbi:hypothetical protein MPDQ_001867 [Monascus purpureus]|uniref:Uncharacterized protein n=1 Tax=Monascus purpureus TaxID=5098 RepID=A0A507QP73_MONPU|nr:hypothetical protein MPDQ_001867 [Monascus purpureus]